MKISALVLLLFSVPALLALSLHQCPDRFNGTVRMVAIAIPLGDCYDAPGFGGLERALVSILRQRLQATARRQGVSLHSEYDPDASRLYVTLFTLPEHEGRLLPLLQSIWRFSWNEDDAKRLREAYTQAQMNRYAILFERCLQASRLPLMQQPAGGEAIPAFIDRLNSRSLNSLFQRLLQRELRVISNHDNPELAAWLQRLPTEHTANVPIGQQTDLPARTVTLVRDENLQDSVITIACRAAGSQSVSGTACLRETLSGPQGLVRQVTDAYDLGLSRSGLVTAGNALFFLQIIVPKGLLQHVYKDLDEVFNSLASGPKQAAHCLQAYANYCYSRQVSLFLYPFFYDWQPPALTENAFANLQLSLHVAAPYQEPLPLQHESSGWQDLLAEQTSALAKTYQNTQARLFQVRHKKDREKIMLFKRAVDKKYAALLVERKYSLRVKGLMKLKGFASNINGDYLFESNHFRLKNELRQMGNQLYMIDAHTDKALVIGPGERWVVRDDRVKRFTRAGFVSLMFAVRAFLDTPLYIRDESATHLILRARDGMEFFWEKQTLQLTSVTFRGFLANPYPAIRYTYQAYTAQAGLLPKRVLQQENGDTAADLTLDYP